MENETPKHLQLNEIKSERHYDYKSINRHSTRTYEWQGVRVYLDRTLDGALPFFHAYRFDYGKSVAVSFKSNGAEYWGEGWTWRKAEEELCRIVVLSH